MLSRNSSNNYLDAKVLTASQPRLQLMLLEGALRFGKQAEELWEGGADYSDLDELLTRTTDIVGELAHSAASGDAEVSRLIENHYASIYRELASCRINQSIDKLRECLELLSYHRETWRQVCLRLETETTPVSSAPIPHSQSDQIRNISSLSLEA